MRKLYMLMMAGLAACAVACQEKPLEPQTPETTPQEGRTMTFTASLAQPDQTPVSKAAFGDKNEDGTVPVLWENGDVITIFDAAGNKADFTTKLSVNSATATFTGTVEGEFKAPYTAVYGVESSKLSFDNEIKGIQIPTVQIAREGNSPKNAIVAVTEPTDGKSLLFKNKSAMLKFQVKEPSVNQVSFVAGDYNVVLSAGEGMHFDPTKYYYMAVNPADYNHFDFKFDNRKVKGYHNNDKAAPFVAGHISNMGAFKYTVFLKGNLAGDDFWGTGKEFIREGDYYILKGVPANAGDQFKLFINEDYMVVKEGYQLNSMTDIWGNGNNSTIPEKGEGTLDFYVTSDFSHVMIAESSHDTFFEIYLQTPTTGGFNFYNMHIWTDGWGSAWPGFTNAYSIDNQAYYKWVVALPKSYADNTRTFQVIFNESRLQTNDSKGFVLKSKMYFKLDEFQNDKKYIPTLIEEQPEDLK